ncbi:MAG: LytTR family transcriptional regulator DNA-binding domain-containing protein [Erysipelotrichaceae bacterium]|jgi:DNA-binding LytR/AlgR family response regulator|nr:LytTR family transcriptional regulator DNA-binding domain-containing protein [Erysipelotrichaceae bacterium]
MDRINDFLKRSKESKKIYDRDLDFSFHYAVSCHSATKGMVLKRNTTGRPMFLNFYKIHYVECQNHTLFVYAQDGVYSHRTTINEFLEALETDAFIRISNSHIVNRFFIETFLIDGHFEVVVDGKWLSVSQSYTNAFKDALCGIKVKENKEPSK